MKPKDNDPGASHKGEAQMKAQLIKTAGAIVTLGAIVMGGVLFISPRVYADDTDQKGQESKIQIGFQIAPVTLNLAGRDRSLVGLGSYIVNGENDCNACHSAGNSPPNFEYLPGGNPYLGQHPAVIDPKTYLAGGHNFGPVGPPPTPDIISRNLTPDKTGRAAGGSTFEEFRQIIRHGKDFDHLHPNCSATRTTNCIPTFTGIDGDLLQIMPWPYFQNMTDHDLLAIYTYLSAIPCNAGPPAPSPLHHDCE
jgi:hypothetical protein